MTKIRSIAITLFLLSFSFIANAQQVYYVSTSGNDLSGNGSKKAPWRSLYKACQSVTKKGDIIHLNAGTFVENRVCSLASGVSLEGEGEKSIITSNNITEQFSAIIELRSSSVNEGNQSISNLTFNGNKMKIAQAFNIVGRSNVEIHHCTFVDFHYLAIWWCGLMNGDNPIYVKNNSFHHNKVDNCAAYDDGYARGALMVGGQENFLLYDNVMRQTGRKKGTNGWPFKVWANEGYIKDSKIYNNTLYKDDNENWDFAIEMNHVQGVEIYNNKITGCVDAVHQQRGKDGYSVYIHDNIIGHEEPLTGDTYGVVLEWESYGAIVRRNYIKNVSIGMSFTTNWGTDLIDFEASYNVFSNINCKGNTPYGGIRVLEDGAKLDNFNVFNNVFYVNENTRAFSGIEIRRGWTSDVGNINIKNNIFVNFSFWFVSPLGSKINGLYLENNILYKNDNDNKPYMENGNPRKYSNKNIVADPKFVSTTNFHLKSGSPGIKKGQKIKSFVLDIEKNLASSQPNIGAYETISK